MPKIGYGSAKNTKHMLPNGFRKVVIHNIKVCSTSLKLLHLQTMWSTFSGCQVLTESKHSFLHRFIFLFATYGSKFYFFVIRSWKSWWCRTASTVPKSAMPSHLRSAKRSSSVLSSWPSSSPTPTPDSAPRRTNKDENYACVELLKIFLLQLQIHLEQFPQVIYCHSSPRKLGLNHNFYARYVEGAYAIEIN